MNVAIRPASADDLPVLLTLYQQLSSDNSTTAEELRRGFAETDAHPGAQIYVAVREEQVVGSFTLYRLPNLTRNARPAMIIENVVVDASVRRAGIGRVMLTFARERAVEAGCYKLSLTTNAARDGAHEFYRRCGMTQHGFSFRYELRDTHLSSRT